jgi:hypothetical protein
MDFLQSNQQQTWRENNEKNDHRGSTHVECYLPSSPVVPARRA